MIANDIILHVCICFRYVGKVPKFWIVCRHRSWYVRGSLDQFADLIVVIVWVGFTSVSDGKQICAT